MDKQNDKKLKSLLEAVPSGALVDAHWMHAKDITRPAIHRYVKNGWLYRLAHGVYLRPSGLKTHIPLDWQVVAASMHQIMELDFHVGGLTALRLQGLGHYLPTGLKEPVNLFADKMPGWLSKLDINAVVTVHGRSLFKDTALGVEPLKRAPVSVGLPLDFPTASPERAILEVLDDLPDGAGFDQLDLVFQNLTNLRPRLLMKLLQSCKKVKVLRLFFVFADRHQQAWLKHLNKSQLAFGSGDRQLMKGGKIHPEYRITIPAHFVDEGGADA